MTSIALSTTNFTIIIKFETEKRNQHKTIPSYSFVLLTQEKNPT